MPENSLYDTETKPSVPSAPQASNLYPDLNQNQNTYTCNSQQFRLVEIQKMRTDLEEKIKSKELKCKKYKKQTKITEGISAALSTVSVLSGSAAVATALPAVTIPLAIPTGAVSAVTGVSSAIVLVISRNRRKKLLVLTDALIIEKSVLNSILSYISRAIEDRFISDDEFQHISKLYGQSERDMNKSVDDINQMAIEIANILKAHKK